MKKIILTTAVMMAMTVSCFAQSKNIEPEYIGQVVILNADSTTVLLQKEAASMKTKSSNWGLLPIPGGMDATMNYSNVPFVAKKYGNNCYIITIENAEPGEYAVNTDFSQMSTFSVK